MSVTDTETDAASLTQAVLSEEHDRLAAQAADTVQTVYADDELPGVGDEEMTVREAIAAGGSGLLIVLSVLNAFDDLDVAAAGLLAPDIQDTLGVSDVVITVATSASSLLLIVGGLVIGRIADRGNRARIVGIATMVWSAGRLRHRASITSALQYFIARSVTGFAKSNTIVVQGPMIADGYPIAGPGSRARPCTAWSVGPAGCWRPWPSAASSCWPAATMAGAGRSASSASPPSSSAP